MNAPPSPRDGHVFGLAIAQTVYGTACLFMGAIMPLGGAVGAANDPEFAHIPYNWALGLVMGGVASCFLWGFAAIFIVGAVGLLKGWKVGWIAALVGCCLWMTSCMVPFGGWGLYALLRRDVMASYTER